MAGPKIVSEDGTKRERKGGRTSELLLSQLLFPFPRPFALPPSLFALPPSWPVLVLERCCVTVSHRVRLVHEITQLPPHPRLVLQQEIGLPRNYSPPQSICLSSRCHFPASPESPGESFAGPLPFSTVTFFALSFLSGGQCLPP